MKIKSISILFLISMITNYGCIGYNSCNNGDVCEIEFRNNSSSFLGLYFSNSYPDTSLKNTLGDIGCSTLKPNSTCNCPSKGGWQDHINELCKGGKLIFFVFSRDTITKYTWDSVEANYKVLKRYEISIEDFQKRGWKVEYPYDSTKGKLNVWPK